eukprot:gb/GEZN01018091.1/.p1 GENE.gb/GEZN01018091.1/~~gb/GEZN01018091.1/.p1  ORF type:complete len:114 (-),score=10.97 gb/GEZN01018091.1/:320-661(-)
MSKSYGKLSGPNQAPKEDKLATAQSKVDEVSRIAKDNIEKVIARGETLDSLDAKASLLNDNASVFKKDARQIKRRFQCENYKATCLICLTISVILTVIILLVFKKQIFGSKGD